MGDIVHQRGVVQRDATEGAPVAARQIVVGVDGSSGARAAVAWCAEMAGALDAEVLAVHALPPFVQVVPPAPPPSVPVYYSEETRERLQQHLEEWCEPLRAAGVPSQAILAEGAPAPTLMQVADDHGAAMLVVGRSGKGGLAELLLGSVAHHLSHHAACPVLVVPA
jgi:nucleotide-binding universal stress UspA family protein